ncbi:MFS transporter [Saccharopolyspora flava]|uniref:Predicted arabinose efflux permease, MFS family n=1 Tax=Saccharopolyspora flava TaxID=95161 RepID=A0A1I6SM94_9PSEU|nr:MFS transporter [Saccharopolyspora flava]SFS78061.1 Predicted arabinose efflux permease, MFS family [Saccharopolyspora flava]
MTRTAHEVDSNADDVPHATAPELPSRFVTSIAFGTVLQPLNSSMIAVALVGIRTEFAAGTSVTWLVSALYLATAVAAPAMGRLADVFGPRRTSLAGFALVGLASAAAPFAPTVPALVACRVLIGIGTAAQYPCGVAMVRRAADRLRARSGNALASLAVCSQVSVALGPSLGGLLVGALGWSGVFWINVPLVVLGAAVMLRWGPADPPSPVGRGARARALLSVDPVGMALFTVSLTALMFWLLSLSEDPQWWWLAIAVPAAAATAWWSLRGEDPFLDVRLLGRSALSLTYLRTVVTYTAFYCVFYGFPQWLEESRGLGPVGAGLVVLPISAVGVVATLTANRLQRNRSHWLSLTIGSAALCAGGALLLVPGASAPIPLLLVIAAVLGLPNGFNNMGNQRAMYAVAPAWAMGAASGLYRTSQYVGANLAAAVLVLTFGARPTDAGLHRMGLAVAGIAAFLLVTAVYGTAVERHRAA